jgi:hypothetical protein
VVTIESRLNDDLKTAMKRKQADRVGCIRQVRSKIQEAANAKGFSGEVDDALHLKVIGSYVKSLQKGIEELQGGGDRGAELRDKYQAEIAYLEQFLPKLLDEAATRAIVEATIAELGISDSKQSGRVMGAVMKAHKGELDPGLTRKLVDEALAPE